MQGVFSIFKTTNLGIRWGIRSWFSIFVTSMKAILVKLCLLCWTNVCVFCVVHLGYQSTDQINLFLDVFWHWKVNSFVEKGEHKFNSLKFRWRNKKHLLRKPFHFYYALNMPNNAITLSPWGAPIRKKYRKELSVKRWKYGSNKFCTRRPYPKMKNISLTKHWILDC